MPDAKCPVCKNPLGLCTCSDPDWAKGKPNPGKPRRAEVQQ